MGIIKLSIGIDTSAAILGIMRFNETKELRFKIVGATHIKALTLVGAFLFCKKGLKQRRKCKPWYRLDVHTHGLTRGTAHAVCITHCLS